MNLGHSPRETLELMLGHLGFVVEIHEEERPAGPTLQIRTGDPGRIIGRNGKTLDDLQYLLNRIITREEGEGAHRVIVDVEGYREQQLGALLEKVKAAADQVRQTGEEAKLPPMNAFERRIIHNTYKEDPELETVSPKDPARLKQITIRRKA